MLLCVLRKADEEAEQLRREVYAKNTVLKMWAERKMAMFHEEMCRAHRDGSDATSSALAGFGV